MAKKVTRETKEGMDDQVPLEPQEIQDQ